MKHRAVKLLVLVITSFVAIGAYTHSFAIDPMSQADESDDPPLTTEQQALVSKLSASELKRIDLALLANADGHWRKVARIVGTTMVSIEQRPKGLPDVFYAQRIQHLVATGALESQGNLKRMRFSEVRLQTKP
jgi:Protein of unknown function